MKKWRKRFSELLKITINSSGLFINIAFRIEMCGALNVSSLATCSHPDSVGDKHLYRRL